MKAIGGYFELELFEGEEYYSSLIKLNTARNALEYILKVKKYDSIYLPYYTCDVLLEPIKKLGIQVKFYHINNDLNPCIDFEIGNSDCFLYTNYFGIKQSTVIQLSKQIDNLIIDNSQAFFSTPLKSVDTFYSCRKFFGVPDGAYLHLNSEVRLNIKTDLSYDRCSHLLMRIDLGPQEAYNKYLENDRSLENNDLKSMSALTKKLLSGINYNCCKEKRKENFMFLQESLEDYNILKIKMLSADAPMVYPLLISNSQLKKKLIQQKIFVPTYWPNVLNWVKSTDFEYYLSENLIPLPIDQRYSPVELKRVVDFIKLQING